jgi:hypothetical protein
MCFCMTVCRSMFGAMSFRSFSVQRSKRGPYFRLDFLKRSAALTKSFILWLPREVFAFVAYQRWRERRNCETEGGRPGRKRSCRAVTPKMKLITFQYVIALMWLSVVGDADKRSVFFSRHWTASPQPYRN